MSPDRRYFSRNIFISGDISRAVRTDTSCVLRDNPTVLWRQFWSGRWTGDPPARHPREVTRCDSLDTFIRVAGVMGGGGGGR